MIREDHQASSQTPKSRTRTFTFTAQARFRGRKRIIKQGKNTRADCFLAGRNRCPRWGASTPRPRGNEVSLASRKGKVV